MVCPFSFTNPIRRYAQPRGQVPGSFHYRPSKIGLAVNTGRGTLCEESEEMQYGTLPKIISHYECLGSQETSNIESLRPIKVFSTASETIGIGFDRQTKQARAIRKATDLLHNAPAV